MSKIKELLTDFKYMNKQNKTQVIGIILGILIGFSVLFFLLFNNKSNDTASPIIADLNDYIAYSYQENGEIHVVNMNESKTISKVKIGDVSKTISENIEFIDNHFFNPYKIVDHNDSIYALDINGSIVEYSFDKTSITESRRITTNNLPIDFKIIDNKIFVIYINSNTLDIFDLSTGSKITSFESNTPIQSFDIVDKYIYIATTEGIEIKHSENLSDSKLIEIDKDSVSTEILGSSFEEPLKKITIQSPSNTNTQQPLSSIDSIKNSTSTSSDSPKKVKTVYVLNTFASDNKNSVVIKFQEGNAVDLIELSKENPIDILESEKMLYIVCKGLNDDYNPDNIVIANKQSSKVRKKLTISDNPLSLYNLDSELVFVVHHNGDIVRVNLNDESVETKYSIPNAKDLVVKKYKK